MINGMFMRNRWIGCVGRNAVCFWDKVALREYPVLTLTHSCLEISLTSVVWTYNSFENNFGIKYEFHKIFEGELLVLF